MSKASDIYVILINRMASKFPTHTRITNPYKIDENNEMALKKGYGIQVGPAINTNRTLAGCMSVERDFVVIFTRKIYAKEQDLDPKQSVEKLLLEDQAILIKDLEKYPDLADTTIAKSIFSSDNGIGYIWGEKDNFIKIETVLKIEYLENL